MEYISISLPWIGWPTANTLTLDYVIIMRVSEHVNVWVLL